MATYTLREAQDRLQVSERTIRAWIAAGKLPAEKRRVGRSWEWRIAVEGVNVLAVQPEAPTLQPETEPLQPEIQPEEEAFQPEVLEVHPEIELVQPEAPAPPALDLVKLESRLDRIEGILAGQIVGDLVGELTGVREGLTRSQEELTALREAVAHLVAEVQQLRAESPERRSWWGRFKGFLGRKLT